MGEKSYELSVISYQLSVTNYQLPIAPKFYLWGTLITNYELRITNYELYSLLTPVVVIFNPKSKI